MRCTAQRAAWFTSAVLLAASAVPGTTAQSEDCVSYNSSFTAGNLWDVSIAYPTYFGCEDGGFLVAVEASSDTSIGPLDALSWTCSGGEVIGSFSSDHSAEGSVLFTVGITQVQTSVEDADYPYLGDMYIGGYDVDNTDAGMSFAWKGPLGDFDDDDVVLSGTSSSYCNDDSFATGVTVWSSTFYVYGVILECADVTAACAPPNYPDSRLDDGSSENLAAIIGGSVGGGLLLIATAVGVACCLCRGRGRATPFSDKTPQSVGAVRSTAKQEQDGGSSTQQAVPAPRSGPPPPYSAPPAYKDPPAYS